MTELQQRVEEQNQLIATYSNDNTRLSNLVESLQSQLGQSADRLSKAQDRIEDQESEIEELRSKIVDLTAQVEEVSVSPLDLTQQQRAKALTLARDVVEETSSSNIFSKSGSKASLAGVVSTAHYICSGERDYVTAEGEFIEWDALAPRRPPPESLVVSDGEDGGDG